jgi:hypothetical protein
MVRLELGHPMVWRVVNHFYVECTGLTDEEFNKKFENTFRCAIIEIDGFYEIEFTDENYTWFVLKWGYHDQ